MTLLTIVQNAAIRVELKNTPSDISQAITSTDPEIQQLVAFAQDVGTELMERYDWRNLKMDAQVIGDGSNTQFSLPVDWQRIRPNPRNSIGSLISTSRPTMPIIGPVNDEWLNQAKAFPAYPAYPVWRLIGGAIEIWPALANAEVVTFGYYSKNWVLDSTGTVRKPAWTADTDIPLMNEDTVLRGVIWRWKRAKGLDYAEEFRSYELSIDRNAGQEDGERVISTSNVGAVGDSTMMWPGIITPF